MSDKGLMTIKEFAADHSKVTEDDVRMCIQGTHPDLPPLLAKKKSVNAAGNQPYLITREAAVRWREQLPDA